MTTSVPAIWHYATGIISFLCLLCGLLANGLVIFVFIRNKILRQPRNYFLINLAVTDLGLLLTNNTLHIIASFNQRWPFGQIGCNFYTVCAGICGLTSIATMMAIALTRLAATINSFGSLKLTGHFTLKCVGCSWIYGSIWVIPPLFGWNRFIFEGFGTSCTFDYMSKGFWDRLYIFILVTGGFFIPLLVILTCYTFILIKLSEGRRFISQNNNDDSSHTEARQTNVYYFHSTKPLNSQNSHRKMTLAPLTDDNQVVQKIHNTEVRVTHTALLICIIYCTAWGPYALMAILSQFGFDYFINAYTTAILGLFTKTAACINSLIYAFSSSAFRQHLRFQIELSQHHLSLSNHR